MRKVRVLPYCKQIVSLGPPIRFQVVCTCTKSGEESVASSKVPGAGGNENSRYWQVTYVTTQSCENRLSNAIFFGTLIITIQPTTLILHCVVHTSTCLSFSVPETMALCYPLMFSQNSANDIANIKRPSFQFTSGLSYNSYCCIYKLSIMQLPMQESVSPS